MAIQIGEKDLKSGVLGLVIVLVEIIRDALKHQASLRMENGALNGEEIERLGQALIALDEAIEQIKIEQGLAESVKAVRDQLDDLVNDLLDENLLTAREDRCPLN